MAKLSSVKYTQGGVHLSLFLLRVGLGLMMLTHGIPKFMHYSNMAPDFYDPMHVSGHVSLGLVLFAEVFCAIFMIIGLFTRWLAIPLLIELLVIAFMVHAQDGFGRQELPLHYFLGFLVILILGPGRISLDGLISRK
jgi:putative oxidoreductase